MATIGLNELPYKSFRPQIQIDAPPTPMRKSYIFLRLFVLLVANQNVAYAHTATAEHSMIATVHPIATDAGLAVFREGGNAVDAAVTAALTLGVVDGENSGIGGGCLILIRTADGKFTAIDG